MTVKAQESEAPLIGMVRIEPFELRDETDFENALDVALRGLRADLLREQARRQVEPSDE